MSKFVEIPNDFLMDVNGGGGPTGKEVLKTYVTEIVKGAATGFVAGSVAGGIGAVPGAFVGAHFGASAASVKLILS